MTQLHLGIDKGMHKVTMDGRKSYSKVFALRARAGSDNGERIAALPIGPIITPRNTSIKRRLTRLI